MKTKEENVAIRPAKEEDIKGILKVQEELLIKNKTQNEVGKNGFLVYSLKEEELKNMISLKQNFLLVAESVREIVGYALAYDLNVWRKNKPQWDEEITADTSIKNHLSKNKIIYFRHIARKSQNPGVGIKLEEKIYEMAKHKGYQFVIGEILERPILNEKSKTVHEQRGYKRIGQVDYPDGKVWGLYEKKL